MTDGIIDVNIKAKVDTSDVKKQFDQIAKNSTTAVERSFKNLESTMRNSIDSMGRHFESDSFVNKLNEQIRALNRQIIETGNLPDKMTSKYYETTRVVKSLISEYYSLRKAQNDLTKDSITYTDTEKFAALKNELALTRDVISGTKTKIVDLTHDYDKLGDVEQRIANLRNRNSSGQKVIDSYDKQIAKLNELKAELAKLRDATMDMPMSSQNSDNPEYNAIIEKRIALIQAIGDQQKKINRYFGENIDQIIEIKNIQAQIRDESLEGGREKVLEQLGKEIEKLKELKAKYADLKAQRDAMPPEERQQAVYTPKDVDVKAMRELDNQIKDVEARIISAASKMNEMSNATNGAAVSMSQMRNVVWSISRVLGNVYTIGLDFARTAKQIANIYRTIWNYGKKLISVFRKFGSSTKGTLLEHIKSWKQALRNVMRYAFGIRTLFALFRRLRGYIKEAFEEMAKQIPEVNQTLSELKSSLGMVKGSLATAFEPILTAIAPALNLLMEKLAQLMTYIGMFFAALTGRNYVYQATKNMQNFTKATKEANKQLQGFDELNNLTTQKNQDDETPMAIFKKVDVPDWIKKIADYIRGLWQKLIDPIKKAWARLGDYVKNAWRRAFYNVKALLMDIVDDFFRAWAEKGQDIAEHFLEIVGDVGNIIANIAEALRTAWKYEDNGYKIWSAILDIVDAILKGVRKITLDIVQWTHNIDLTPAMTAFRKWLESLVPVVEMVMDILYDFWHDAIKPILDWAFNGENSGIARFFNLLTEFNDKLNKSKIREDLDLIWQALGRFGINVGEGLLDFIERMLGYLSEWLNSDEFTEWCQNVAKFLDDIEPGDIADDLEQVWRIVKELAKQVSDAISWVIKHKDFILNALEFAADHLKGILALIIAFKTVIDFARLAANIYLMVTAIEKLGGLSVFLTTLKSGFAGLWTTVTSTLIPVTMIIAGVVTAIKAVVDMFKNGWSVVSTIIEAIGIAAAAIGAFLLGVPGLVVAVVAAVIFVVTQLAIFIKDHWEEIKLLVRLGIESVKQWISDKIENIKIIVSTAIKIIKDWLAKFVEDVKSKAESIKIAFKLCVEAVKGWFRSALNNIKQWFVNLINWIVEKINWAANKLNELKNSKGFGTVVSLVGGSSPALNAIQQSAQTRSVVRSVQPQIPGLANGAVIPPNNEFLALLGDQKSGTNIETPLATMVEAFNTAGGPTSQEELMLMREQNQLLRGILERCGITNRQIFKSVQQSAVDYTKSTGKKAFA